MKTEILGVRLDFFSGEQILKKIGDFFQNSKQNLIFTPNPEILLKAYSDEGYRSILNSSTLNIPDGIGILLARHLMTARSNSAFISGVRMVFFPVLLWWRKKSLIKKYGEIVAGTDLMQEICGKFSRKIFLLGGAPGIAEKTILKMKKNYANADFAGFFSGSPGKEYVGEIVHKVNSSEAEILFVAFGAPAQEKWIFEHISKMPAIKVAMGVGGAFDFISGKVPRAPRFFRIVGLEWLFRLFIQPWRYKRIFNALITFPITIIGDMRKKL